MNKTQKKTLRLLAGILVVLAAALAVVLTVKSRQAAQEEEETASQAQEGVITPQHAYSAISYSNGSSTLSFTVNEAGEWIWADDPDFPLDDSTILSMVELLSALKPQQTITEGDTLEAYGLDQPFATLTATAQDGSILTLALGNATTDGTSYYMLMNGEETPVYIIADTLYQDYMSKAIYDMCLLPELPVLTAENLENLTIRGAEATVIRAVRAEGEAVSWTSGGVDVTGRAEVSALLSELGTLRLTRCVDYKPSDQAADICGFTTPAASLTVLYRTESGAEQTLSLVLGGKTLDGAGYYIRVGDDTTIYQAPAGSVEALLSVAAAGLAG